MALSLYLRASLKDPDDHKVKSLPCSSELDIYNNKRQTIIAIHMIIQKKLSDTPAKLEDPCAHSM